MRLRQIPGALGSRRGATLLELMVAVAIVGILAAVALPSLIGYIKDARMSEAVTNIQGILEAEEAYFARFMHYTDRLGWCPEALPANFNESQLWPGGNLEVACNNPAGSGRGWAMLGWHPDGAVNFRYRVFSHYNDATQQTNLAPMAELANDPNPGPDGTIGADATNWGINWVAEGFAGAQLQPWCAVEAQADTDGDGRYVFLRSNSYNRKIFQRPNVW